MSTTDNVNIDAGSNKELSDSSLTSLIEIKTPEDVSKAVEHMNMLELEMLAHEEQGREWLYRRIAHGVLVIRAIHDDAELRKFFIKHCKDRGIKPPETPASGELPNPYLIYCRGFFARKEKDGTWVVNRSREHLARVFRHLVEKRLNTVEDILEFIRSASVEVVKDNGSKKLLTRLEAIKHMDAEAYPKATREKDPYGDPKTRRAIEKVKPVAKPFKLDATFVPNEEEFCLAVMRKRKDDSGEWELLYGAPADSSVIMKHVREGYETHKAQLDKRSGFKVGNGVSAQMPADEVRN